MSASNLHTPALSASNTADPSPESFTVVSPAASELELEPTFPNDAQFKVIPRIPECWGHRGASASYPENTRASFIEACNAGADGIETDIHITSDNVLVMFHDPNLERTTNGKGKIDHQPWNGVLEHVRTLEEPHQPIPRFTEVLDILMMPENKNVKLNLDCKVENPPAKLFTLVKRAIETYPGWQSRLAPRIILGIWHPKFLAPAQEILPYLPRFAISMSLEETRKYFWKHVHGFSILFQALASPEGARFRDECRAAHKDLCSWTVNGREEMLDCVRWGIRCIISDKPEQWREIRRQILKDPEVLKPSIATHVLPWLSKKYYRFDYERLASEETEYLEREGGRFADVVVPEIEMRIAKPGDAL
ncbi:PLC-like phosphodiesterase [Naematelia encephala]|uniref:PLC-like phosphodiesterase n=1 Tax=Naematelia encephala TaxID=71784 RepID=A0A1Y2B2S2_9TREE|nr:PLC-like phosphodiesterase [Naematelia encephala]